MDEADAPVAGPGSAPGSGTSGSRGRVGRRSRGSGPVAYDFRRPTKLSREHVRTLQIVFETFSRQYTTLLTSTLRTVAQVNLVSIDQLTYDEYVSQLANPTHMAVLSVEPLPGAGVLEFSVGTAMACVDHLLGGPGAESQPERALSEIEATLLRGLLDRVLGELRYAFEGVLRLEPTITGIEYNPQFAQVASASDMVLVASFDMKVGAVETVATVCLPFNPTLAALDAASGAHTTGERERLAREEAARRVRDRLQDVPVEVAVRFAGTAARPRDLVNLQVGDVLPLKHNTGDPLTVTAADIVFAHAVPGAAGKRLAVLVVESPENSNPLKPEEPA
ncbi:flagellar motor switch protein FliM [Motilibacter sp. K478]|nr:flagellar motor switch protein FliM [Motilibacter aurantiacus]